MHLEHITAPMQIVWYKKMMMKYNKNLLELLTDLFAVLF